MFLPGLQRVAAALFNQYVSVCAASPVVSIGVGSNQSIINKEILTVEKQGL